MASISTGSSHGGKRALDHDVPLVPFIDLLLCCVMFLLVTAVWNRLAAMQASTLVPSQESEIVAPPDAPSLTVLLRADRYVVASAAGDRVELPFASGASDPEALRAHLALRRASSADDVLVSADDGIAYATVIETMDAIASAGFGDVAIADVRF
ncbi:ExbD/TolR family protein [Sandaracinus amylolyticus]|uniref:ExbD/TolR family protein n=1 Tax=Sandaracinus amylolyticus TaxID=927083 RepID=UPI001F177F40|nr:biopolymer transporter ExbD [Sandaracinus amylolyticus]UJR83501.1 Hypothetical protein I5071_55690 [Sandaracinus amylolyticus]